MRPAVLVVIGIAGVSAIGTAMLVNSLVTPPPPVITTESAPVPSKPRTVQVLVAGAALEVGRTLTSDNLEWQEWPEGSVRRDQGIAMALSEAERGDVVRQYEGSVVRTPMVRGEPFVEDKVLRPAGGGLLALVLAPGMRSATVAVTAISGAAGMVQPGDRVDVLLTMPLQDAQSGEVSAVTRRARPRMMTETVLRNVRVLSRERSLNPATAIDAPIPANITFEVTPQQAELLTTASAMGSLSLILRPLRSGPDPDRVGIPVMTDVQVTPGLQAARRDIPLADLDPTENPFGRTPAPPPPVEVTAPVAPANANRNTMVIYRGTAPTIVQLQNGRVVSDPGAINPIPPAAAAAVQGMLGNGNPGGAILNLPPSAAPPMQRPAAVEPPSAPSAEGGQAPAPAAGQTGTGGNPRPAGQAN